MKDLIKLNTQLVKLMLDSQIVITQRMLGLSGLKPMAASEPLRMGMEKAGAFTEAALRAQTAALKGLTPQQIGTAAVRPVARTAKANRKRLS